jgi:hypothetical protein
MNLGVFAAIGQVGCLTVLIVFAAIAAGMWLDAQVGRRGLFTIGFVVLSIPLSLWLNFKLAMRTAKRFSPLPTEPGPTLKEE